MKNWNEVEGQLLGNAKKIMVVSHRSPDGDSIGSSLAIYHWLSYLGHKVTVASPDPAANFLAWLPGFEELYNHQVNREFTEKAIVEAEVVICLDFNNLSRTGEMQQALKDNDNAYFVNIDHHQSPDDFADFQWCDTTASSTAELVFQFVEKLSGRAWMNRDFANCVYTGILTDTGSFRFPYTSAKTHQIAAFLLELGVKPDEVYQNVFDSYSVDRLKLLGFALNEALSIYPKYKTAIIALSKKDLMQFNYKKGDTEGLVNYPLSIKDISMSILITETDNKVKLSFRSKGDIKVNEIAEKYFNGGGHINAAGGISEVSVKESREKIENFLSEYETILNK